MAKVRCISTEVIENNVFTSLPMSAKMLYIYINEETDNLGFVDNMDIVIAKAKAKKKDLQLLIDREYVIQVKEWLYLEKHFRLNNKNLRPERGAKSRFDKYIVDKVRKDKGEWSEDWLFEEDDRNIYQPTKCRQNADNLPTICGFLGTQSKVKENKVKESNINQSKIIETRDELRARLRGE